MSKTYAVVIEKADGNFSAYVPDECEESIQEAIEAHIHVMREQGMAVPEPSSLAREIEVELA